MIRFRGLLQATAWLAAAFMMSGCAMQQGPGPAPGKEGGSSAVTRPASRGVGTSPAPGVSGAPEQSLRMQRGSSPQRVASVRMTERAVRLLRSGQHARALSELEKSLSTDGTNPYAHYYIAVAHYRLGDFKASLDFLDAAEPVLGRDPSWLVQGLVLRGDNLRALGRFGAAGEAYRRALSMDAANPSAARGLQWTRQRSRQVRSW